MIVTFWLAGLIPCLQAGTNLLKNGDFSKKMNFWAAGRLPFKTQGNKLIAKVPANNSPYSKLLIQPVQLVEGKLYRLSFQLECREKGIFRAVYQQSQNPYTSLGLVKNWELTPGIHSLETVFTALSSNGIPAQLVFNYSRMSGEVILSSVHLEEVSLAKLPFAINPEWQIFWKTGNLPDFFKIPTQANSITTRMRGNWIDLRKLNPGKFQPGHSTIVFILPEKVLCGSDSPLTGISTYISTACMF